MLHPDITLKFVSEEIGYGLFATKLIPKGTVTWTQCLLDKVYKPSELDKLPQNYIKILDKYGYLNKDGDTILHWDLAIYMNHSCTANTIPLDLEIQLGVACRDILPGEQVTCDYGEFVNSPMNCACGSTNCRGIIYPEDIITYSNHWHEIAKKLVSHVDQVEQPLSEFILDKNLFNKVIHKLNTEAKMTLSEATNS